MARRGRRVAVLAAAGAISAAVVAAVFWRDIAAAYYLHKLRSEPAYYERILDATEDTAAGVAMKRFFGSPNAVAIFVERLVELLNPEFPNGYLVDRWREAQFSSFAAISRSSEIQRDESLPSRTQRDSLRIHFTYDPVRVNQLFRWLALAYGTEARLPSYPEVSFALIDGDECKRRFTGHGVVRNRSETLIEARPIVFLTREVEPEQFWADPASPAVPADTEAPDEAGQ